VIKTFLSALWQDTKTFFKNLSFPRDEKREYLFLSAVMLVALAYRLYAIQKPITYDEAYNYLAFIRGSFIKTMTDYHLPNNHIFLSLLLNLTIRLFGDAQWVLRMPTLIFGILMIPATYGFGKRFYGKYAGLLAAVGVAIFPELVHYSSIFRGYILVALFTLLAFNLADDLRQEKNRFGWGVLTLILILGLYTVPTMLFPFAILYVWFLGVIVSNDFGESYGAQEYSDDEFARRMHLRRSNLNERETASAQKRAPRGFIFNKSQWDFLRYTIINGALTGLGTLILYSPILYLTPDNLLNHRWLEKVPMNMLFDQMKGKVIINFGIWFGDFPNWLVGAIVIGIIVSLLAHRQLGKHQLPLQFAFAIGIVAVLLAQRPNNPWARVWSFSIAFFMVWAAAGIIEWIKNRRIQNIILALALLGSVWGAWLNAHTPIEPSKEQLVAELLAPRIQENDVIIVEGDYAAPIEYYLLRAGKPREYFHPDKPFEHAFLVIVTKGGYTFNDFIGKYAPKYALDVETLTPLYAFGNYEVYEIEPLP
jgi:hypothetical protein